MSNGRAKVRSGIGWASLGLKFVGLALLLLYLVGAFQYGSRISLYESIRDGEAVPASTATAQELLAHLEVQSDSALATIARVEPTYDEPRGDSVLLLVPENPAVRIAHIEEVRAWAQRDRIAYLWSSFALAALAFAIDLFLRLLGPAPAVLG